MMLRGVTLALFSPWLLLAACGDGAATEPAVGSTAAGGASATSSTSAGGAGGAGGEGMTGGGGALVDPGCTEDGCLREVTHLGDYTVADLSPLVDPSVVLENGYSLYTVRFSTAGREALATVAVPYQTDPPVPGWHILSNNHGTTGAADACATTGTGSGAGLAGLYGARGAIGVAPDYPGLGTAGSHPYLVSASEGHAALDALRAAEALAHWLDVPTSGRFAVTGLSQGGHATLAAAALHAAYAPELDIRAFAAAGPASVWLEYWQPGLSSLGPHVVYHALLAWAWATHYGYEGPTLWAPGLAPHMDDVFESVCAFPPTPMPSVLDGVLGEDASGIFAPGFLAAW